MNERLRTVMLQRGVSVQDLALACAVDPKTISRWINPGRVPHREHRWKSAKLLDADETYLWPELLDRDPHRQRETAQAELIQLYPHRAAVPRDLWTHLLGKSKHHVDMLVYAGTFFAQTPRIARMLAERAGAGVQIRLCIGDPSSQAVDVRDREEGLRGTLASKIKASLTYYRALSGVSGCEMRLHGTTLYASLFRYDDTMMVNPHAWGQPASTNPLLHLRRLDAAAGVFDHYLDSFEGVWKTAEPWQPKDWG
jgi:transcriptional regulator with XRE-family HTH domain